MTEDGWFPKINSGGAIASGSAAIWLTDAQGSHLVSEVGTSPVWAGGALVFNRKNGTTDVGGQVVHADYNELIGSDDDRWAGFYAPGDGRVDVYRGMTKESSNNTMCAPRFGGPHFAYLAPFQAEWRNLVVDNVVIAHERIMDVQLSRGGEFYVYMQATGTYTRQIVDHKGRLVSLRDDETPLVAFVGPGGEPWMLSGTQIGTFVRPLNSSMGYFIEGDLYNPDARVFGDHLRVVASYANGMPRFDIRIFFAAPRIDLTKIGAVQPPIEPPIVPPIEPPIVPPITPPI